MTPRQSRRSSGQILVIMLLGIVLLGGLVFYVINVGDQVNRRLTMQNAADSVAMAGAANMARFMNVIGVNNVAQSRMLAAVPVLDAFPLSVGMAHEEVGQWVVALNSQLAKGVNDSNLRMGLESLRDRMTRQRDILAPVDDFLNHSSFRMENVTFWRLDGQAVPPPHGQLWRASESLDQFSQATLESAPLLSQANAVRYGQMDEAQSSFIVPVVPELPGRRTHYNDFKTAVGNGLIPDRQYFHRLGPYDRLFKWRDYRYEDITQNGQFIPPKPGHGDIRGGQGHVDATGRVRGHSAKGYTDNGHWTSEVVGRILRGYTVYGPFQWMLRRIGGYAQWGGGPSSIGELADTFFHDYQTRIAQIKLGYMWGSQQLQRIHYPQWVPDYVQARALAGRGDVKVKRTMFYVVEIRSRYPENDPNYLSPGSFITNGKVPIALWVDGWEDPAQWNVPLLPGTDSIWEDQYFYETTEDWDIGIRRVLDAAGNPTWQKVYMIAQYVFAGIDVGGDVEVRNPANYSNSNELPAPVLMDTTKGDYDVRFPQHDGYDEPFSGPDSVRRQVFTYLGVARAPNAARVWPRRFGSGNPFDSVVALSQVEIFNTTSWDLWTQDWKAQLVPVTKWTDWTRQLQDGVTQASATQGMVDPNAVSGVYDYLSKFDQELARMMLRH